MLTTRPSLANESSINRSEAVAGAASNDGNGNDHAMDVDERPPTTATEAEASQPSGLAASTTAISAFSEPEIASMRNRKEIYDAILAGQISHAMTLIQAQFPWLLDTSREAGPGFREWMDEEMENGGGGDGDPAVDALATDIGYSNGYGGKVSGSGNRASLANTPRGDRGDGATRSQSNGGGSTPVTVNGLGVSTGVGSSSSIAGGSGGGPGAITNSFGSVGVNVSVNTHNANNTANKSSSSSLPSVASMDRDFTNGPQAPPLLGEDSAYPVPPFPYAHVLGRPTFLVLNLEIQAFVEGLREVAHSIPSSPPTTAGSSLASSMHSDMGAAGGTGNGSAVTAGNGNGMDSDASVRPGAGGRGGGAGGGGPPSVSSATATTRARDTRSILSCLEAAGGLHTRAKALPPKQAKVYGAEVEKVTALLAYTDMEASPLRGYLDPRRRLQLADMVNGALLGEPPCLFFERIRKQWSLIGSFFFPPVLVVCLISPRWPTSTSRLGDCRPSHDTDTASCCGSWA